MYTAKPFDPSRPMFAFADQNQVVQDSSDFIGMMMKSRDIKEWNINRSIIKSLVKHVNLLGYIMLMGHIDNVVFQAWKK